MKGRGVRPDGVQCRMRGKRPDPTHLKLLKGTPGGRPINRHEPKPIGALHEAPADLPEGAVPFWDQAIASAPRGLLRRLDERVLFLWTVAAWAHSDAVAKLAEANGLTSYNRKNHRQQMNPLLSIIDREANVMLRAAAELGFSPTSRSRVVVREGDLAEATNPFEEFADT